MDKYFVYIYFDSKRPGCITIDGVLYHFTPIYVGKGTGKRDNTHLNLVRNKIKLNKRLTKFQYRLSEMISDGNTPLIVRHKDNMTNSLALKLESKIIDELKLIDEGGYLYNLVKNGTHGNTNRQFDDDWKKKLSIAKLGERNPMKLEENKTKLSIAKKGKTHSELTKEKISKKTKGVNNPNFGNYKTVIQKNIKGEEIKIWYNGLKDISEQTKINQSNIIQTCLGKRKTAGGYIWEYKIK